MAERTSQPGEPRRPTLDELLDRADPAAAAELQKLAAGDPKVKRHAQIQSQVDAALRGRFEAPEFSINVPAAPRRRSAMRWVAWAAAAVLVLAGVGAWRIWTVANRPDVLGPLYRQVVEAGFVPEEVCTTDEQFSSWCRSYVRQPLYPVARPEGIEYVGWNKGRVIGPISGILLVRVGGQPVIVVLDRADRQTVEPGKIADRTLHSFRRRIGDVVLYEITPKSEPDILPLLETKPGR